jgi:Aldo/keto reductase family
VIRESAERSQDRLGMARLDLLYAHIEDPAVPLAETVEAFAALVAGGTVGLLGVSNHWAWRVERARSLAAAAGLPGYEVLQYHYSYLRPRTDLPGPLSPDGEQGVLGGDLLSYLRAEPQLVMVAYSPCSTAATSARTSRWTPSSITPVRLPGWPPCGRWPRRPARR